jgi:hypothetical protein
MAEDGPPTSAPPESRTHHFTVRRGMSVVLVIETTSWYLGLLQSAMARVKLEGDN